MQLCGSLLLSEILCSDCLGSVLVFLLIVNVSIMMRSQKKSSTSSEQNSHLPLFLCYQILVANQLIFPSVMACWWDIHFYIFLTQKPIREAYLANQSPQLEFLEMSVHLFLASPVSFCLVSPVIECTFNLIIQFPVGIYGLIEIAWTILEYLKHENVDGDTVKQNKNQILLTKNNKIESGSFLVSLFSQASQIVFFWLLSRYVLY